MATTSDIRNGLCIRYNNDIYKIIEFLHVKPGKGPAFVRTKMKSVTSGKVLDNTFSAGHKLEDVRVETHKFQYLYNDGEFYHFMDLETYDQPAIRAEVLGEATQYLKEELEVKLTFYQGEPLDIELPITVDLEIIRAEASVRGDTATGVTKKVTTETGLDVQVPNFVNQGDTIRVDTRTATYVTRV